MIRFALTFLVRRLMLAVIVLAAVNVAVHGMIGSAATSRSLLDTLAGLPKALDTIHRAFR